MTTILAIGIGGWMLWRRETLYAYNTDACVQSDIVTLAAQMASVKVNENDYA